MLTLFLLFLLTLFPQPATAQSTVQATHTTAKITLDGRLSEDAWQTAIPYSAFSQADPDQGAPSSETTEVHFLYTNDALFVGVALSDDDPSAVVSRPARRDDFQDGDYFQLYLDPYHDRTTGALFQVNAAGSLRDFNISNDTRTDVSWDAVWDAAVARTETGWSIEIQIPFSQLRFANAEKQIWGVNMARFIFRKNETSWFHLVPKTDYGLASRFADLLGIEGVEPGRNLEVLPYLRGNLTGKDFSTGSGLDVRYGLRNSLTLNATMNPDFGQVEVDPAVVNLSAFETFFQERRPFFVEGSQIFSNFGKLGGVCCISSPTYFYSRRIGRAPKGTASGDIVTKPAAATILGAGKLTGKFGKDWSVAVLNASTTSEYADVTRSGQHSKVKIEPAANYTIGRVLREFGNRGGFGVLGTAVVRHLDAPDLRDIMPSSSQVLGGDGYYYFGAERSWSVNGRMSGAWNYGSAAEVDSLQRAPQHYLQRPDATHLHYDPSATVMKGWSGGTNVGKISGGWTASASLYGNSPGFDVNDAGFQGNSDFWVSSFRFNWRQNKPDRLTRTRSITLVRTDTRNFNNDPAGRYTQISASFTFLNYWSIFADAYLNQTGFDSRLTRGGPMTKLTPDHNYFVNVSSDGRKRFNFSTSSGSGHSDQGNWFVDENVNVGVKPASSVTFSIGPSFNRNHQIAQYIRTEADATAVHTYGKRYLFAELDQTTLGLTTRANWILTPKISLQVFQQLLLSAGDYSSFKQLDQPRTLSFTRLDQIGFSEPDFNFKSLITNAVFRWEWRPGSTFFVVWQQSRSDSQYPGSISPGRDLRAVFGAPATNVLLVKTTYWFKP